MRLQLLPCKFLKFFALATCLQTNVALASIYPTQPVAKTTFSSGQIALVTWRDDWRTPLLTDMAHMRINLHGNNSVYITTLAKNVAPITCSHSVFIPPGLPTASHYTLRFITAKAHKPPMTFYTADFTITTESYLFPVRPINITASSFNTSTCSSSVSSPTAHPNPLGAHPGTPFGASGSGTGSAKKSTSTKVNLDTFQFRALAFLCPTLVGISMAL
ncbi:hypothetical protein D9615_009803 [Tricholomella constricta]|uniref:Uncharacterized protein n=1 Tax=Tricholomella constricta TaxID=117010 RepID=A0A8H5GTG0_9AGAR|nr:hypothetical protein D9615_009803 [Tricholomella constricta]